MPDFAYSGRLELLVWSIPIMTVILVGGVTWIGSYDLDPPKPIASAEKPVRVQVVSLDWKWLFIYPDHGIAAVNQLTIPVGHAHQLRTDLFGGDEQLLCAAARRPDLHNGRDGDAPLSQGRPSRDLSRDIGKLQRRRIFRHVLQSRCGSGREICAVGGCNAHQWLRYSMRKAMPTLAKPSQAVTPFTYRAVAPDLFNGILSNVGSVVQSGDPLRLASVASQRAEK